MTRTLPLLLALSACTVLPELDRTPCDPSLDEPGQCPTGTVCLADDPLDEDAELGTTTLGLCGVDEDGDGWRAALDCDDADPEIHPGALETCNGADQDCDGAVDNDASDAGAWFVDVDGDGFGVLEGSVWACEAPDARVGNPEDCNDADPDIRPGADELCDGLDNDCDEAVDEDAVDRVETWRDRDGDGFGWGTPILSCTVLDGEVLNDDDCNDWDAEQFPGNTARDYPSDGIDNDCDGEEGPPCEDLDCDGFPDLVLSESAQRAHPVWPTDLKVILSHGNSDLRDGVLRELPTAWNRHPLVSDLDKDGWLDLIVDGHRGDGVIFWGGPGGPAARRQSPLPGYSREQRLCLADLDGDGFDEVIQLPLVRGTGPVRVRLSEGGRRTGNHIEALSFAAGHCAAADFDGDGIEDVALLGYNLGRLISGHADGPAGWTETTIEVSGSRMNGAEVTDLDEDGHPDLIGVTFIPVGRDESTDEDNIASSYIWFGPPPFSRRTALETQGGSDVGVGDLNDDGRLDLVFVGGRADYSDYFTTAYIYLNDGADFSGPGVHDPEVHRLSTWGARQAVIFDADDDGSNDLLIASQGDSRTRWEVDSSVWWGDSSGSFTEADRTLLPTMGALSVSVGDVDGDGTTDLVWSGWNRDLPHSEADFRPYKDSIVYFDADSRDLSEADAWAIPVIGNMRACLVGSSDRVLGGERCQSAQWPR